jgi:hypothetical protein
VNRLSNRSKNAAWATFVTAAALCLALAPAAAAQDVAQVRAGSGGLDFLPVVEHGGFVLTVSGPEGFHHRAEFGSGESPSFSTFDHAGGVLPDGVYNYELRVVPNDTQRREAFEANQVATKAGAGLERPVQSGAFSIIGGAVVAGGETEPGAGPGTAGPVLNAKDQVIPDDLIVQGSLCVGFDCVNNESFGFDTIRLKENNTRIKFEDTSVGSFPSTDWQLTANDSASGGQNKFSIEDVSGVRVPFTIEGGSTTNSIYVDSTGRVGFRTSTPVLDIHVATSNTPGLRLEQTSAGGFTAQTWDVAGNEANFFVRSVTTGSQLPFRIRPGAPTSSLDIAANGDVGIGTSSPDEKLHVFEDTNANTFAVVENSNTGTDAAGVLRAASNTAIVNFQAHGSGRTISRFGETLGGWSELLQASGNGLIVGTLGATPLILGTNQANVLEITAAGTVLYLGSPVHPDYVFEPDYELESIEEHAAYMWENKHLPAVGPGRYAEDGRAIHELGESRAGILEELEKAHIYIDQLNDQLKTKDEQVEQLEVRLEDRDQALTELAERLARLERGLLE